MKAERVFTHLPPADLGEGPSWDHENSLLYWVDITGKAVHRYDVGNNEHKILKTPSMVGFAVATAGGGLMTGLADGVYTLHFETGAIRKIASPDAMPADNRFNDGKCDRRGRLWCGTMNLNPDHARPTGELFRLGRAGLHSFEKNIFISNGLGWSPDNRTMYYTDTVRRTIWQYDYDIETGTPANRRVFLQKDDGPGRPDGLCVDSQGRILTALWPGWGVEIFTPDGKPDGRIEVPAPQVSSCAFGGADLKTLFITTAKTGMAPDKMAEAPLSGCLFAVDMTVPGLPETPFRPD